ncbi:tubulin-specific chaperone A-like [Ornithodoros turicata]|uniref:Tubulin-specific chaperone A n=1 Tax=Ornithodoros turicata TaxID=34597 RepID=A0A2R5LE36_9ACAR
MGDSRVRQMKIKTGIVKRISKEKSTYEKEVEIEKQRLVKFKEQEKEEAALHRQEEVIQETLMMVPHCQKRLLVAWNDLKTALEAAEDLADSNEYKDAQAILEESKLHLPSS